MLRKDREMPAKWAESIIDKCKWAVVSMTGEDGAPYCTPVSIARDGNFVYFHSGKAAGARTRALLKDPRVCVSCVGDVNPGYWKNFTTEYESAIFRGTAVPVTEAEEKIHALRLICERYTPEAMEHFEAAVERSLKITAVWKISIEELTGKRKKYDRNGVEMKYGRMETEYASRA